MTPEIVPAPASSQRATAREFFAVVFRRRWIIIGLFLVTLVTVMVVAFSTPTEYLRSLIREDRRRVEQEQFSPVILKWLSEGQLTADEEASLPAGLLDRLRRQLERKLLEGLDSGDAGELTRNRLTGILRVLHGARQFEDLLTDESTE